MKKYLFEYTKLQDGTVKPNGWWEIDGNRLVNPAGGYHLYVPSPDDKIVEAESFFDLDHSYLLDSDSEYGWISPEGQFYGCDYHCHEDVAQYIFGVPSNELEEMGWVKIYSDIFMKRKAWYCDKFPTEYQKATLEKHGLTV